LLHAFCGFIFSLLFGVTSIGRYAGCEIVILDCVSNRTDVVPPAILTGLFLDLGYFSRLNALGVKLVTPVDHLDNFSQNQALGCPVGIVTDSSSDDVCVLGRLGGRFLIGANDTESCHTVYSLARTICLSRIHSTNASCPLGDKDHYHNYHDRESFHPFCGSPLRHSGSWRYPGRLRSPRIG